MGYKCCNTNFTLSCLFSDCFLEKVLKYGCVWGLMIIQCVLQTSFFFIAIEHSTQSDAEKKIYRTLFLSAFIVGALGFGLFFVFHEDFYQREMKITLVSENDFYSVPIDKETEEKIEQVELLEKEE